MRLTSCFWFEAGEVKIQNSKVKMWVAIMYKWACFCRVSFHAKTPGKQRSNDAGGGD